MNTNDYQTQVWTVVLYVWGIGIGAFVAMFLVMGAAMLWTENKDAIKGNVSIILNVLGFFAIVAAEWLYVTARDLWERSVPDFGKENE